MSVRDDIEFALANNDEILLLNACDNANKLNDLARGELLACIDASDDEFKKIVARVNLVGIDLDDVITKLYSRGYTEKAIHVARYDPETLFFRAMKLNHRITAIVCAQAIDKYDRVRAVKAFIIGLNAAARAGSVGSIEAFRNVIKDKSFKHIMKDVMNKALFNGHNDVVKLLIDSGVSIEASQINSFITSKSRDWVRALEIIELSKLVETIDKTNPDAWMECESLEALGALSEVIKLSGSTELGERIETYCVAEKMRQELSKS